MHRFLTLLHLTMLPPTSQDSFNSEASQDDRPYILLVPWLLPLWPVMYGCGALTSPVRSILRDRAGAVPFVA